MRLAAMMLLLAASLSAAVTPVRPDRQATATVRIVRAEPVRFAEVERNRPNDLRSTVIRDRDGRSERARLLEYQ